MWVDLRVDAAADIDRNDAASLAALYQAHSEAWKAAFVDWLGGLNRKYASLGWWAHTAGAKNFLSSPLGNDCFELLALVQLVQETAVRTIYIVGARAAQVAAFREWARLHAPGLNIVAPLRLPVALFESVARIVWQLVRAVEARMLAKRHDIPVPRPLDAILFTYVDGRFCDGPDAFFGSLLDMLEKRSPPIRGCHVAFLHAPYREVVPKLSASANCSYRLLFAALAPADIAWAFLISLRAWRRISTYEAPHLEGIPITSVFRAALHWDLRKGGYLQNLLVYRAVKRLLAKCQPRLLIYPYENKSIEKMLLLGTREAHPGCRIVGFQHTSITMRHTTLLLAKSEAAVTPLPDRIVTVGDFTRELLEREGAYPEGILVAGCALRQHWRPVLVPRARDGAIRVLLALSSSRRELLESVRFCMHAKALCSAMQLGIRPHPEFPVSKLPAERRAWIAQNARDFTGTDLGENLEWCDIVVYVSSTVALEALMSGRPVINLRLSDSIDPDPVLAPLPLAWKAASPEAFIAAIRQCQSMSVAEHTTATLASRKWMQRYFRPITEKTCEPFLADIQVASQRNA